MAGELATWIGAGTLTLAAAAALAVGGLLLASERRDGSRTWLGARLLGSCLLIAALAALTLGGVRDPRGSGLELLAFTAGIAGASLHLLDVPYALSRTRDRRSQTLPGWLGGLPLLVPLGFLLYAVQHWPASTLPASATPREWAGWAGYDAVEDAAGLLVTAGILLGALLVSLLLVERSLRAPGQRRDRARRMLAQAWLPVAAWVGALGLVWLGLALQDPPASGALLVAQEVLLDGPLAFSLAIVGPLLWGLDERSGPGLADRAEASPRSNRS